jgi:hypothetical protein
MAIDTAEKRRSVSGMYQFLSPSVTPSSAKGLSWRRESAWAYPFTVILHIVEICGVPVSLIHL